MKKYPGATALALLSSSAIATDCKRGPRKLFVGLDLNNDQNPVVAGYA